MIERIIYTAEILFPLTLSICFLRDYEARKVRASLAWGVGFLLYGFLVNYVIITLVSFATERDKYIIYRIAAFGVIVLGMMLLYYGIFLLLFHQESFFRKKMKAIIIVIYLVYVLLLIQKYGDLPEPVLLLAQALKIPIFLMMAALFYRSYRKISFDDPSKRIPLIASVASLLLAVSFVPVEPLLFHVVQVTLDPIPVSGLIFYGVKSVAWILMLYSARNPAALIGGETEIPV